MKITIAGNYGAGNLGDEMILEGLLKVLNNVGEEFDITVLSGDPKETNKRFNIKTAKKFPAGMKSLFRYFIKKDKQTLKAIKNCDYFILGGGGLFENLSLKANIIWGIQASVAYKYKKPVIMCGQSIGEIKGFFTKWMIKKIFNKAKLIILRDLDSKISLEKIGIKKHIYVFPDLAFNIQISQSIEEREKTILVALRTLDKLPTDFLDEIAKFLNKKSREGYKIKILDFQKGSKRENDKFIHKQLLEKAKNNSIEYIKKDYSLEASLEEILKEFSKAKMVIGMRLHSIITAIITKTPFMAINYSPKIKGLLKTFKLEDLSIDMNEVKEDNLEKIRTIAKTLEIHEKLETINEKIKEENNELKSILHKTFSSSK